MRKLKAFPAKLELKVTELRNYKPKYIENEMVIVNNQEDEKGEGIVSIIHVNFSFCEDGKRDERISKCSCYEIQQLLYKFLVHLSTTTISPN